MSADVQHYKVTHPLAWGSSHYKSNVTWAWNLCPHTQSKLLQEIRMIAMKMANSHRLFSTLSVGSSITHPITNWEPFYYTIPSSSHTEGKKISRPGTCEDVFEFILALFDMKTVTKSFALSVFSAIVPLPDPMPLFSQLFGAQHQ